MNAWKWACVLMASFVVAATCAVVGWRVEMGGGNWIPWMGGIVLAYAASAVATTRIVAGDSGKDGAE